MAVVESDQWGVALRRYNNKIDSTPFRELVSRMPGLCILLCAYMTLTLLHITTS